MKKLYLYCIILMMPLLICGCGAAQYPTGAMTDNATLTVICNGRELVLDGVTLATLVTTELTYSVTEGDSVSQGESSEAVSVVFDLCKYLAGEDLACDQARTWVLTDREGRSVYVPTDQVTDSLYIGITDNATNLDYPVSVIPDGLSQWRVWDLAQVEFSATAADELEAQRREAQQEAERQAAEQAARDAVPGCRCLALLPGDYGDGRTTLADFIADRLPAAPQGQVAAVLWDGTDAALEAKQVLSARVEQGVISLADGGAANWLCLSYDREGLWLGGEVELEQLADYCGLIRATDYTWYSVTGQKLSLTGEEMAGLSLSRVEGKWRLSRGEAILLDGAVSLLAGEPLLEGESSQED